MDHAEAAARQVLSQHECTRRLAIAPDGMNGDFRGRAEIEARVAAMVVERDWLGAGLREKIVDPLRLFNYCREHIRIHLLAALNLVLALLICW